MVTYMYSTLVKEAGFRRGELGNGRTATIGERVQRIQVEREDRRVRLVQAARVVGGLRRALRVDTRARVPVKCAERRPDRLALS